MRDNVTEATRKTDEFNDFVRLLKDFSEVREGTLFRALKNGIRLPLLREHCTGPNGSYTSNGGFARHVILNKDDSLFLYQIETHGVENAYYIWHGSNLPNEPCYETYEKHVVDNYMRRSLETLTFYFLVQQGEETKRCYLVLCNETVSSMRVFFSLFKMISPGLDSSYTESFSRSRNDNSKTLQMSFSWNKPEEPSET